MNTYSFVKSKTHENDRQNEKIKKIEGIRFNGCVIFVLCRSFFILIYRIYAHGRE